MPSPNGRFGASGAVSRLKVCAKLEVSFPSERQWKPRLRQAAGTLCAIWQSGGTINREKEKLENMTMLVLGASGATGKQLVEQLLLMEQQVKVIVRPLANIPNTWNENDRVTIIRASLSEMSVGEIINYTTDCQAIASCLGHGSTIYGKPRKLVTDAVKVLCNAVEKNTSDNVVKFVLMNTAGFRNKDLDERISLGQKIMMSIIRTLVPPHLDNELAAEFLRLNIGQKNAKIQWVVVRPDNLTNEDNVTDYNLSVSPTSTLFKPNKVSRINVAHFMARLIVENDLWEEWQGKMPVIDNK